MISPMLTALPSIETSEYPAGQFVIRTSMYCAMKTKKKNGLLVNHSSKYIRNALDDEVRYRAMRVPLA